MNDMPRIAIAKVEWIGDEQVIHLPRGYHLDTTEVRVTFEGAGVVVEEPEDGVDLDTGLPIAELRRLIAEGLEGPDEVLDMEDIKRRGRERLAAGRDR